MTDINAQQLSGALSDAGTPDEHPPFRKTSVGNARSLVFRWLLRTADWERCRFPRLTGERRGSDGDCRGLHGIPGSERGSEFRGLKVGYGQFLLAAPGQVRVPDAGHFP